MLSDSSIIVSRKSIKKNSFEMLEKLSLDISLAQTQIKQLYNICLKTVKILF